jgi:spermidine synthase
VQAWFVRLEASTVKPWIRVQESRTADGNLVEVVRRDDEYSLRVAGKVLMGSRSQGSEIQLAQRTLAKIEGLQAPRVLVGGLGFGYTLQAALQTLPATAFVEVVELMPFMIELNRGHLGELAGNPLNDARVKVTQADIVQHLKHKNEVYDAILLDVDNGPRAFTQEGNSWLYKQPGLVRIAKLLSPGGALGVWSVSQDDAFTGQLRASGYQVESHSVRSRANGKGDRHTIWVAQPLRKPDPAPLLD